MHPASRMVSNFVATLPTEIDMWELDALNPKKPFVFTYIMRSAKGVGKVVFEHADKAVTKDDGVAVLYVGTSDAVKHYSYDSTVESVLIVLEEAAEMQDMLPASTKIRDKFLRKLKAEIKKRTGVEATSKVLQRGALNPFIEITPKGTEHFPKSFRTLLHSVTKRAIMSDKLPYTEWVQVMQAMMDRNYQVSK